MEKENHPQEVIRRVLHVCKVLASVAQPEDLQHQCHTTSHEEHPAQPLQAAASSGSPSTRNTQLEVAQ